MKKTLFISFNISLFFLLTFTTASADIVYKPLAPIPGVFESSITLGKESSLAPYLNQIVRILIMVATGLAVLMVVKGGIQYSLTDSLTSKGEGRATIVRALQGLLLALASYMILNTLNPALLSGNIRGMNELEIDAVRAGDGFGSIEVAGTQAIPDNNSTLGGTRLIYPNDPSYPYQPEDPRYGTAVMVSNKPTGNNFDLQQSSGGKVITPGRVAIDTDGKTRPPFSDPDWRGQTSLAGLDANTDYYVVVPIGSDIPLGTKVSVTNNTTGRTINAIVGDRGPTANGFGELSLAAARDLGAWVPGDGNSAKQHSITYTFVGQ